jgi:homoserine O-acetyltransferase/O-succinyltransferase
VNFETRLRRASKTVAVVMLVILLGASARRAVHAAVKWPTVDGTFTIANFRFGTGENLPQLRLHYLTLGHPHLSAGKIDNAVLLLHGTGGNAHSLLAPQFSTVLFGPGQPLDITKYFLILPDDIGHGDSSKPSDGLKAHFPHYDYDDMVASQHTMLLDGLHVDHLRLILGTSMGCMQAFVWGETYPGFADALMPLACLPVQIAGRNRIVRSMIMDAIRNDPAWSNGDYTAPPPSLRTVKEILLLMNSSPLLLQKAAPARDTADNYLSSYLSRRTADANDLLYFIDASRNYDPSTHLDRITVPVMWVNSEDDFINPPELRIAERYVTQMPRAQFILIPTSDATVGHGTNSEAALWKQYLVQLLTRSMMITPRGFKPSPVP